jgi:hypothetical protein
MNLKRRLLALVILASHGIALPAPAEVVHYDNSHGDFAWVPDTPGGTFNYFDPTQPPTQTGQQTPFGLFHTNLFPETSGGVAVNSIAPDPEPPKRIAIAVGDSFTVQSGEGGHATVTPATTFLPGETVGPDAVWTYQADLDFVTYIGGRTSLLGDPPLIGFRTETNGQYQYGWIELGVRSPPYEPIRWAYETELNTPITVIPEPASVISLLFFLVLAACLRSVWPKALR